MCGVVLKQDYQKVKNSPEQERRGIIREIKTDVTPMKAAATNIPPSRPPKTDPSPPKPFQDSSPVFGTNYLEFDWSVPTDGTAVLKERVKHPL